MKRSNQQGAALLITLILVLVLSVMTASMMFLAQSETWSSANYRLMTQTRYGAEAGLHAAANYIINPTTGYPGIGGSDPITAYNVSSSPVTYSGSPVVLSSLSGVTANYPISSVKTNFNSATTGSLTAGASTINYTASAQLLEMKQIVQCANAGSSQYLTSQLWKLTSHGDIGGVRNAEVEVSALLESHIVPCYKYAAFATGTGCGAINWSGGGPIDSYDSGNVAAGTQSYDGNVGSNGNANLAPHTSITGQFYSPETGVGACSSGGVDAISGATSSTLDQYVGGCESGPPPAGQTYCTTNGLVTLPQSVTYPTPATSYPAGANAESTLPTSIGTPATGNSGCPAGVGCYGDINNNVTLMPTIVGTYGNPGYSCTPATYYIDSLVLNGGKTLTVGTCPDPGMTYQPIVLNIVGINNSSLPLDIGGGSIVNSSLNPSMLQIQYAGTGQIKVHGGSSASATVYAPNAPVELDGANSSWYGALITNTLTLNGNGASIHYDRQLQNTVATVGNWTMDTFTWSKY